MNKFRFIYFFVIVVLYVGIGTLLLIKYLFWQRVPYLAMFGLLTILYGLFRAYRLFKSTKTDHPEENDPGHREDRF